MYYTSFVVSVVCILLLPTLALAQLNCSSLPPHTPSTILDLRPGDISVIMAMGDSFTTGFGALDSGNETYGVSFSVGGDPGALTLATLFQNFTSSLVGASVGSAPAQVCYGTNCPAARYYNQESNNAAKSGAMVGDMTSSQIAYLIRQVNLEAVNVQNSWKVLTIMIGTNDLCASCAFNLSYLDPDDYQNNLMATLERVRISLPRTFVNLVGGYNISQVYEASQEGHHCNFATRSTYVSCDCLFHPDAGDIRETMDSSISQFNDRAQAVATYYQRKAYDNFAVVFQPFATNLNLADTRGFISKTDCFHPSVAGQQAMAVALWNNMLTPSASKQTFINMDDTPICPTATTLLYTY